jgi:rhamnosyltransferase
MLCSIIIRAFNEEKHIGKLINGILSQETEHDLEIILVDSGSTDNTVKIAEYLGARVVNIRPEEFSFGYALNLGCSVAKGDFLLFASAHVYPIYTNWIEKMLEPFNDKDVALVYGRQVGNEDSKYSERRLMAKWFPEFSNPDQKYPFCNNANAVVRRSIWESLPYDVTLTGLEDLDWASKVLKNGHKIFYEAEAVIVHIHEETPKKIFNRYYREAIAFKRIVPYARFGFWDFLYLSSINIISDYYFAVRDGVFLKNIVDIPVFRVYQFFGTWKGYNHNGNLDYSVRAKFYYPNNFFRKPQKVVIDAPKVPYT